MEKTIKHELYKHGSYLLSLKESGSSFVNIDDEIKKNEELFQLASKKDHQPAFSVGEYYFYKSMENVLHILKITAVMGNIVEAGFLDTETGKLINTRIELDKKYVQPATAEQIATFKRTEQFAAEGREWSEFRKGDIVQNTKTMQLGLVESVDEDGDAWVNYNIDKPLIYPSCCKCTGALFLNLIQTAEELQEVGE